MWNYLFPWTFFFVIFRTRILHWIESHFYVTEKFNLCHKPVCLYPYILYLHFLIVRLNPRKQALLTFIDNLLCKGDGEGKIVNYVRK